eukprot:TRINITY_DN465_c0_g2_i1.p1 TRINITY_DN465_c0_g2~~TRINITY_DN465_c0_g2_i1.p1  ORF type:complete len:434 (-),score=91.78 TRINITY_DN465_c0_g2_i1:826-2127(-)
MDSQNSSLSEDTGLNLSLDRTQNEATSSRILSTPSPLQLPTTRYGVFNSPFTPRLQGESGIPFFVSPTSFSTPFGESNIFRPYQNHSTYFITPEQQNGTNALGLEDSFFKQKEPVSTETELGSPYRSPSDSRRFLQAKRVITTTSTAKLSSPAAPSSPQPSTSDRKRRAEDFSKLSPYLIVPGSSPKPLATKNKRQGKLALKYEDEEKEEEEVDEEQSSESETEDEEEVNENFSESPKKLRLGNNIAIRVSVPTTVPTPVERPIQATNTDTRVVKKYNLRSRKSKAGAEIKNKRKPCAENNNNARDGSKRMRIARDLAQLPTADRAPFQAENSVTTSAQVESKYDLRTRAPKPTQAKMEKKGKKEEGVEKGKEVVKEDLVPSNIVCVGNMKDDGNGLEVEVTLRDRKTPVRVSFGLLEDYYSSAKRGGRAAGN